MEETFQIRNQAGGWRERRAADPTAENAQVERLFSWIPFGAVKNLAEIGAEGGERGELLLQNYLGVNAHYVGFSPRDNSQKSLGSRGSLRPIAPTGGLSLETASQDLFLAIFALENLRMDHLYMALSEARRVVKLGGYAALLSHAPGETLLERAHDWMLRQTRKENPIRLDHYLSPEDWETVKEESMTNKKRRVQLMLLRRKNDLDLLPSDETI